MLKLTKQQLHLLSHIRKFKTILQIVVEHHFIATATARGAICFLRRERRLLTRF